jgi:hypothetical protein
MRCRRSSSGSEQSIAAWADRIAALIAKYHALEEMLPEAVLRGLTTVTSD